MPLPSPMKRALRAVERDIKVYTVVLGFFVIFFAVTLTIAYTLHSDEVFKTPPPGRRTPLSVKNLVVSVATTPRPTPRPSSPPLTAAPTTPAFDIMRPGVSLSSPYFSSSSSNLFLFAKTSGRHELISSVAQLKEVVNTSSSSSLRWQVDFNPDLIIGMASNTADTSLAIFLKSARAAASSAEIMLFVSYPSMTRATPRTLDLLRSSGAHVVEYKQVALEPDFLRNYHPSSLRWVLYSRLFSAYDALLAPVFDKVIHCDVRDVQFGDDPFRHLNDPRAVLSSRPVERMTRSGQLITFTSATLEGAGGDAACTVQENVVDLSKAANEQVVSSNARKTMHGACMAPQGPAAVQGRRGQQQQQVVITFKEEEAPKLGDCSWNAGWVRDCFGVGLLEVIKRSDISCSGVLLGTAPAIYKYIDLMSSTLQGRGSLTHLFPQCERNGVDQGAHNVLLHSGLVPELQFHSSGTFPSVVSHMQSDPYASVSTSDPVRVKDTTGLPVSIVHQYDRNEALQQKFTSQYATWMANATYSMLWNDPTSGCTSYRRVIQFDLFKGKCDFGSFRSPTPDACCHQCDAKVGCTSFSFSLGVCWFKKCSAVEIAHVFANFTITRALQLPMVAYVAVADESQTPVTSLVLTGMRQDLLMRGRADLSVAASIYAVRKQFNRDGLPAQIGNQGVFTSDVTHLASQYMQYLPTIEAELQKF